VRRGSRGASIVDYIGIIATVGVMMLGLLVVRPHVIRGRDPVGAVPYVVRLLGEQVRQLPTARTAPVRPRPPVKRRPRPAKPRVVAQLPEWWVRR
jgi:hypothetical protein